MDENGWWICKSCPDKKYNFCFELFNHWKKVHESPFKDAFSLEDLILSGKEILERDQKFQKMGWPCGQCTTEEVFEHKFQMVTWQYGLSSFHGRDTKADFFLVKNQLRILLCFVNRQKLTYIDFLMD